MPTQLLVQSILALSNAFPERDLPARQIKKPTDAKIKMLVLQQIVQALGKPGALFPSATAPKVVIGLLSSLHAPKKTREKIQLLPAKHRAKRPAFRGGIPKRVPVGLRRCEPHNWINSLMQFFLFLPGSWELCSLIPRSFQSLREFADQYFADQEENLPVSSADSAEVVRCLIRKLPPQFLQRKPSLFDLLLAVTKTLFSNCPFTMPGEIHPVVLHPEWHLPLGPGDLEARFVEKLRETPPEILVGMKESPFLLKSNYFNVPGGAYYDLDAFVELRPDGDQNEHLIAYLKCGGGWHQCDDDRIVPFRSNCLNAPLRRAALLHFKRVDLIRDKMELKK